MHELSLCGSIASIALRRAGDRRVDAIHLQIGQLRQVVPDTLVYCWSLVSADTALDGARLVIEKVPGRVTCRACGQVSSIGSVPVFACHGCGGFDVEVISGEECLVESLELAEA